MKLGKNAVVEFKEKVENVMSKFEKDHTKTNMIINLKTLNDKLDTFIKSTESFMTIPDAVYKGIEKYI